MMSFLPGLNWVIFVTVFLLLCFWRRKWLAEKLGFGVDRDALKLVTAIRQATCCEPADKRDAIAKSCDDIEKQLTPKKAVDK
jgi:hypothetical protein